jgi:Mrp family chromosome partitioning ATPase/uncharacterized protein involved in exopolysaccharide biosynthesis
MSSVNPENPFDPSPASVFKEADDDDLMERFDSKKLLHGLGRHLLLIISSMIGFGILGGLATYHYLTTYKADAIVLFQEDMPKTLSGGYILTNFSLPTVLDMIKLPSNYVAAKAILGLSLNAKTLEDMTDISTPRNNSNLIRIEVKSDNQNLAIDLANTVAKIAVKNSQEFYQKQLQTALENFKTELENMRSRLTSQTQDIEEFKKLHQYFEMTADYAGLLNQIQEARSSYDSAVLRYNSLLVEYENLKQQFENIPAQKPVSIISQNNPMQVRVLGLQSALAEARAHYSSENPKVKALESELSELMKQYGGNESDQKGKIMEPNPAKEKVQLDLMRMEGKVRSAQKTKQDLFINLSKLEKQSLTLPSEQMVFSKLLQNKTITEEQIKFLNNAVESTQLLLNVPKGSMELYQLADRAQPDKDSLLINLLPILGLLFGLGSGIAASLFLEMKDPYMRTAKQVELAYHAPSLQVIPEIPSLTKKNVEEATLFFIRNIAERLEIAAKKTPKHADQALSIAFLSSQENEGKSLISYHLAKYYQRLNKKVVYLEFDHRPNPFIEAPPETFPSLETYLRGAADINDVVMHGKPDLITVRQAETKMKEFLKSPHMHTLWDKLNKDYDIVIIDAPGIIEDQYAPNLAKLCDLSVFIIGSSFVPKKILDESLKELEAMHVKLTGVILNRVLPIYIDNKRIKLESKRVQKAFWQKLAFWKHD